MEPLFDLAGRTVAVDGNLPMDAVLDALLRMNSDPKRWRTPITVYLGVLYFCSLEMDTMRAMTMCCLPSINTMQVEGQIRVAVTCEPLDLLNLLKRDFMPMNLMCEQSGMSEEQIYDRTKAVFEYFGLPFDTDPPAVRRF